MKQNKVKGKQEELYIFLAPMWPTPPPLCPQTPCLPPPCPQQYNTSILSSENERK